jgi:hypothetical protein
VQIEIYAGLKKVAPIPMPVIPSVEVPQYVVPASAKGGPVVEEPGRAGDSLVQALTALRDGTKSVTRATVNMLDAVSDRAMMMRPEQRTIVLASYMPPPAARLDAATALGFTPLTSQPAAPPAQQQQPTVVVIREPAESRPAPAAPESARGLTLSPETLTIIGLSIAGMFGMVALIRTTRRPTVIPPAPVSIVPPVPPDPNTVRLMGQYNAGPRPDTAEKFEIGPSYHDELKQKKVVEEQNNTAAVEFILNQNLALLAALNPDAASGEQPAEVLVDLAGFAVPAEEAAALTDDDFIVGLSAHAAPVVG